MLVEEYFEYIEKPNCVCGSKLSGHGIKVSKIYELGNIVFERCDVCRSWNQSPQISIDSQKKWYNSDFYQQSKTSDDTKGIYFDYESAEKQRKKECENRYLSQIRPLFREPGTVLEVGCASGSMLAVMQNSGWDVTGVEVSDRFAALSKKLNDLDIIVDDFLNADLGATKFDIVIMLGTVSNLYDFPSHAERAFSILKDGGYLYLNFPHSSSLVSKLYGQNYWMFTPSISTFFSKKGMGDALKNAGFNTFSFKQDYQQPSILKITNLSKLYAISRLLHALKISDLGVPFPLPIPGVMSGIAQKQISS